MKNLFYSFFLVMLFIPSLIYAQKGDLTFKTIESQTSNWNGTEWIPLRPWKGHIMNGKINIYSNIITLYANITTTYYTSIIEVDKHPGISFTTYKVDAPESEINNRIMFTLYEDESKLDMMTIYDDKEMIVFTLKF